MDDPLIRQIKNELSAIDEERRRLSEKMAEVEAEGYRIVNSGSGSQVEIWDERTQEPMGTWNVHKPWPEKWHHIDRIADEIFGTVEVPEVDSLPSSLISAIHDWTIEHQEEATEMTGMFWFMKR